MLDRSPFKILRPVGRDVFRRCVQTVRHRTLRGFRPKATEDIVGSTTQQQIESVAVCRNNGFSCSSVVMRRRPSAVFETVTCIFLWAAGRLDHAVQRDMLDDPDFSHAVSLITFNPGWVAQAAFWLSLVHYIVERPRPEFDRTPRKYPLFFFTRRYASR